MNQKSIISIDDLSIDDINHILNDAEMFEKNIFHQVPSLEKKIFSIMFYEPSTRTNLSFQSAINRLNSKMIIYNHDMSSSKKGESIYDTIKTMESYCDGIIVRHPDQETVKFISQISSIPVINAGNGNGEHPTQALLDLFTIKKYFSNNIFTIAFSGDLKNSRTIHSLIRLLDRLYLNITFYFISCHELELEQSFKNNIKNIFYEVKNINDIIYKIDVLYMTRIQKEREDILSSYNINLSEETLKYSKNNLIVLHPLPRNDEIPPILDKNPKCKYFEQVKNGVYVRMAILKYCSI